MDNKKIACELVKLAKTLVGRDEEIPGHIAGAIERLTVAAKADGIDVYGARRSDIARGLKRSPKAAIVTMEKDGVSASVIIREKGSMGGFSDVVYQFNKETVKNPDKVVEKFLDRVRYEKEQNDRESLNKGEAQRIVAEMEKNGFHGLKVDADAYRVSVKHNFGKNGYGELRGKMVAGKLVFDFTFNTSTEVDMDTAKKLVDLLKDKS